MSGKIDKYVVLKADFNCKCLSVYFTKYLFYQSFLLVHQFTSHKNSQSIFVASKYREAQKIFVYFSMQRISRISAFSSRFCRSASFFRLVFTFMFLPDYQCGEWTCKKLALTLSPFYPFLHLLVWPIPRFYCV